jgi:hypothetical protein
MQTIHTPSLVRRLLAGAFLLAGLVLAQPPARAQAVVPTSALYNPDGSLAGFATSEPSLYFLAPSKWSPLAGGYGPPVRVTAAGTSATGEALYDLRLVLSPDYARAAPTVVAIRGQDAHALFFPLPMAIEHVTLFLPAALGSVQAELVPDEQGMTTPVALYYRLRFTAEQLDVLRVLAQGGLTLQGTIAYSYAAPEGTGETATPLTIILAPAQLAVSSEPAPDPTAWLADLLATTMMSIPGALDGAYPLGGGISVQISHSRVEGWLLPGSWVLQAGGDNTIRLAPTRPEDLAGRVVFDVAQLGATIRVDYQATFAASLDLSFMRLSIAQLDITKVTVNGSPSSFYTALLKKLMKDPAVRARISQALSDELQRRILAETLFTLGDVLP